MDPYRLPGPRPGLLQRVAAGLMGVVVLTALFFLGIIAWVVLAGIVFMASIALSIWVWRQKRRFEKQVRQRNDAFSDVAGTATKDEVIEGEFQVLSEKPRSRTRP